MLPALARFVEALRAEGVEVSPAELLDAARAAEAVGPEDRRRFRGALAAALAKDRRRLVLFDRTFDRFFAPPPRAPRKKGKERAGAGEGGGRTTALGEGPPRKSPPKRDPEDRRETVRRALEGTRPGSSRREGRLRRASMRREEASPRGPTPHRPEDPLRRELKRPMATEEERRLAALVPRLLEEIRRKGSRRLVRARRGRLFARRVFRENVSRGGVPFVLPYRRRKPRPAKVVLLVDVSHSVARAAAFFLSMALSFLEAGRRARVVLFVDRPVDATAALARWARGRAAAPPARRGKRAGTRAGEGIARGGVSFADLLEGLPDLDLGAASDYGRAFHSLLASHLRPTGRDTLLVVLGDGRTNRFEPIAWTLEEIGRRSGAVLWLVPEPESRWGTGDSALGAYLPHADLVVEAADLSGLARGVAELVRRL